MVFLESESFRTRISLNGQHCLLRDNARRISGVKGIISVYLLKEGRFYFL